MAALCSRTRVHVVDDRRLTTPHAHRGPALKDESGPALLSLLFVDATHSRTRLRCPSHASRHLPSQSSQSVLCPALGRRPRRRRRPARPRRSPHPRRASRSNRLPPTPRRGSSSSRTGSRRWRKPTQRTRRPRPPHQSFRPRATASASARRTTRSPSGCAATCSPTHDSSTRTGPSCRGRAPSCCGACAPSWRPRRTSTSACD